MTIQQGDAIHQPDLGKQTSLSAALDQAAGGRPADPQEEGLFDRVREEYSRYFTERGAEKKDLQEARKLQTETRAEIARIEQQIRDLEQDIERSATLQRELGQLKKQEDEQGKAVVAYTASLEEIRASGECPCGGSLEAGVSAEVRANGTPRQGNAPRSR